MAGFIDIACNFTHESFKRNLEEVIKDAELAGVEKFVLLCASLADLDPIKKIQNNAPNKFFISAGIHPHHATETVEINFDQLLRQLQSITPHAIGETGLDYHYNYSPKDKQIASFKMHCDISKETNLPLIIHNRLGEKDILSILTHQKKINPKLKFQNNFIPIQIVWETLLCLIY